MQRYISSDYQKPGQRAETGLKQVFYLASEVDEHLNAVGGSTQGLLNRIRDLEIALTRISECYLCCGGTTSGCQGRQAHELAAQALSL